MRYKIRNTEEISCHCTVLVEKKLKVTDMCQERRNSFSRAAGKSDVTKTWKNQSLPFTSVTQAFSSRSCEGDVLIFAKRTRWTAELCNKVIPVPALRDSSDPCPVGGRQ